MNMFDQCPTEARQVIGAPAALGAMLAAFSPAAGELWEITYGGAAYDDIATPDAQWWHSDGLLDTPCSNPTSYAAGEYMPLYSGFFPVTLYMGDKDTLMYSVLGGATDGALITLNIIGRVMRGVSQ